MHPRLRVRRLRNPAHHCDRRVFLRKEEIAPVHLVLAERPVDLGLHSHSLDVRHRVNRLVSDRRQLRRTHPDRDLLRAHPCRRAAIADRCRVLLPEVMADSSVKVRDLASRCDRCLLEEAPADKAEHLLHVPAVDRAGRVDLRVHSSSAVDRCQQVRVRDPVHRVDRACCHRFPTECRRRRNRASRFMRASLPSGSVLFRTGVKLKVSANCIRRVSVQVRVAEAWQP